MEARLETEKSSGEVELKRSKPEIEQRVQAMLKRFLANSGSVEEMMAALNEVQKQKSEMAGSFKNYIRGKVLQSMPAIEKALYKVMPTIPNSSYSALTSLNILLGMGSADGSDSFNYMLLSRLFGLSEADAADAKNWVASFKYHIGRIKAEKDFMRLAAELIAAIDSKYFVDSLNVTPGSSKYDDIKGAVASGKLAVADAAIELLESDNELFKMYFLLHLFGFTQEDYKQFMQLLTGVFMEMELEKKLGISVDGQASNQYLLPLKEKMDKHSEMEKLIFAMNAKAETSMLCAALIDELARNEKAVLYRTAQQVVYKLTSGEITAKRLSDIFDEIKEDRVSAETGGFFGKIFKDPRRNSKTADIQNQLKSGAMLPLTGMVEFLNGVGGEGPHSLKRASIQKIINVSTDESEVSKGEALVMIHGVQRAAERALNQQPASTNQEEQQLTSSSNLSRR